MALKNGLAAKFDNDEQIVVRSCLGGREKERERERESERKGSVREIHCDA